MRNRRLIQLLFLIIIILFSCKNEDMAYKNPDLPIEARIDDLLQRMTLEEKIEQLAGDDSPLKQELMIYCNV